MSFRTDDFENGIEKLAEQTEIRYVDLLDTEFMRAHTSFDSLEAFLSAININSEEDFVGLVEGNKDRSVARVTPFQSWEEMIGAAYAGHVGKELSFIP